MDEFTELLTLKKSRKKPKEGDIFILQPSEGLYYYGKVIKTGIESTNPFLNGWNLIYISGRPVADKNEVNFDLSQGLLVPPVVTNNKGWYDGFFETIQSNEVTDQELNLSYGFWDDIKKKYRNEHGYTLTSQPVFVSGYGLVSYGGIGRAIHKVLNNEPHLM